MKNRKKLAFSLAAIVLALSISGIAQKTGQYKPTDPENAGVGLAADFAVKTRSDKTKKTVELVKIVNAEDQEPVLGARNFKLCMNVTTNGKASSARAYVTMDQYSNLKLVSWAAAKCVAPKSDGFEKVANDDPGIGLAADFAVKKHSEDTKIEHKVATILKAEEKGKFEMTYRVCMQVTEGDEKPVIQAVVTMDQYSNLKLVSWKHSDCGN